MCAHVFSAQHPVHYLLLRKGRRKISFVPRCLHSAYVQSRIEIGYDAGRILIREVETGHNLHAQKERPRRWSIRGARWGAPADVANNAAIANADATRSGWFWLAPGGGLHLFQRCQGYGKSSSSSGLGHAIGTRERRNEQRYASLPQRAIGDRLGTRKPTGTRGYFFVLSQASSEPLRSGA